MEWNVFKLNMSTGKIAVFNIFEHGRFREDCRDTARKFSGDKSAFTKEIESHLLYYFWSKFEYEIFFSDKYLGGNERKIDIYQQVKTNWDRFIEYIWDNIDMLKMME